MSSELAWSKAGSKGPKATTPKANRANPVRQGLRADEEKPMLTRSRAKKLKSRQAMPTTKGTGPVHTRL